MFYCGSLAADSGQHKQHVTFHVSSQTERTNRQIPSVVFCPQPRVIRVMC